MNCTKQPRLDDLQRSDLVGIESPMATWHSFNIVHEVPGVRTAKYREVDASLIAQSRQLISRRCHLRIFGLACVIGSKSVEKSMY